MIEHTASELLALLTHGDATAEEVCAAFLDAIKKREDKVKAFLHVDADSAFDQARAIDHRRKAGESLGSLAGLPIAIKDVLCIAGQPTTCASKMLKNYI